MLLDRRWNLDADRDLERFTAVHEMDANHKNQWADVTAYDECNGQERRYKLVPTGKDLSFTQISGPSRLGRRAVLFVMGYGPRSGVARVMNLRLRPGQACPSPYALFSYSMSRPPKAPPDGMLLRDFDLVPWNDSQRYPGPELVLLEFYGRAAGDLLAKRLTYFRYRSGRYVAYRRKLSRV